MRSQESSSQGEIRTSRLLMRPATSELLRADLEGQEPLARALGLAVAEDWPPELYDADAIRWTLRALERDPVSFGWLAYYVIRTAPAHALPKLIGVGGFKGRPDERGVVEIGYGVIQSERRHGYATEAARGLLGRAFADASVSAVAAETMPDLVASIGVIEKIGMRLVGAGTESGVIRFAIAREEYEGSGRQGGHLPR